MEEGANVGFSFIIIITMTWKWQSSSAKTEWIILKTREMATCTSGGSRSRKITVDELKQIVIDSEETVWSVENMAQMLGISCQAVRKRILRGLIPAHKDGHFWYILKSEYISRLRSK